MKDGGFSTLGSRPAATPASKSPASTRPAFPLDPTKEEPLAKTQDRYLRTDENAAALDHAASVEPGRALALADVRQRLDALGFEPVGSTPEETTAFLRSELARWGKVIRERGITME